MVLGAGVGVDDAAGLPPPAGVVWYVGRGIEGALGSLAMLCCKSLLKTDKQTYSFIYKLLYTSANYIKKKWQNKFNM